MKRLIIKIIPTLILSYIIILKKSGGRKFLFDNNGLSIRNKLLLFYRFIKISEKIECAHSDIEIIEIASTILTLQKTSGVIVECGSYKGGSAVKLSLICNILKKELHLFDSFEGIPDNKENHIETISGERICGFKKGDYLGTYQEVKGNIEKFGKPKLVYFHKGWFNDTMPSFNATVIVVYLDVDLVESTRTCIKFLWPLIVKGGVIISQDGHLPMVVKLLSDDDFWLHEVGVSKPKIEGLGIQKLVKIFKDSCLI